MKSSITGEIESVEVRESQVALVRSLADAGDDAALMALVKARATDKGFINATKVRDSLYKIMDSYNEKIRIAKGYIAGADGNKSVSYVDVRENSIAYRDLFEEVSVLNRNLNEYRAVTAEAVMVATQIREDREKANGTFLTYDADTIGSLVAGGEFESGSPEWHEQRLGGIGGSDVAKIMKTDVDYGVADYREILRTKCGLPDESGNTDAFRDDLTTAVGRGNAWEEAIRHMYADANPDKNVAFCKTSWEGVGERSYVHANFDGLELDENGFPVGIIEIKTGVHSKKWGSTEDGFEGMPANYRQQAIWYAGNAGLRDVTLVAVLDDYDYREYKFSMSDPRAQAEWAAMNEATAEFWTLVELRRDELARGIDNVSSVRRSGFPKSVNMKQSAIKLAAYTGEDFDTCYEIVRDQFDKLDMPASERTIDDIQRALTAAYAQHNPNFRNKPLIGIDIETNYASPKRGRIIETGIVALNADGSMETLFSELHGISDKAAYGIGAGLTDVHRISLDMLDGKTPFEDESVQAEVLGYLRSGVIVAHNASFEKEFLAVNLAGFAEALDAGEIQILDTRQIVTHLMLDAEDNSLSSFAESNGIPYAGAHAATTDTVMMMLALRNFMVTLHHNGVFVATEITDDARAKAEAAASIYDQNR